MSVAGQSLLWKHGHFLGVALTQADVTPVNLKNLQPHTGQLYGSARDPSLRKVGIKV